VKKILGERTLRSPISGLLCSSQWLMMLKVMREIYAMLAGKTRQLLALSVAVDDYHRYSVITVRGASLMTKLASCSAVCLEVVEVI
jgi:hypothetical protein